jgi:hypothetical protein
MSREDNIKHQREIEAFRQGAKFATQNKPRWYKDATVVVVIVAAVIGAGVLLYTQGPEVEAVNVQITCAICDNPEQIHPPTSPRDNGASIDVKIQNSGSMGTIVLDHNTTLYLRSGPLPRDFQESPDLNDNISVGLGSDSVATLSFPTNEAIIYGMRHGLRVGSSIGPIEFTPAYLLGHVTYRNGFYFPVTKKFCFQYGPPYKGLPEKWGVCQR